MTDGVMYVYDPNNTIQMNLNSDYVGISSMDDDDFMDLKVNLNQHHFYTKSQHTKKILTQFQQYKKKFKKILPLGQINTPELAN